MRWGPAWRPPVSTCCAIPSAPSTTRPPSRRPSRGWTAPSPSRRRTAWKWAPAPGSSAVSRTTPPSWRDCRVVLLTLGTAWVWRALERPGQPVVANCLKRPAREFAHELLSVEACAELLRSIVEAHPEKHFLLTVSPIRHLGAGAHANTISKSTLHLAVEQVLSSFAGLTGESPVAYFPAYEIVNDELRDYRFYADDLVHPAPVAVQLVWERFLDACTDPAERERIHDAERASRAASHRPLR